MTKSAVAREFRSKYKEKPTLSLARILYNKNKLLFKDVEDARTFLRYIEGKRGAKNKTKVINSEFLMEEARPYNPYKLPESDEAVYEPYILKGHKRIALFCDLHIPYHSVHAISKAIEFAKKEKIDGLILDGDALDFHGLSRFLKDPRKKNFGAELQVFKNVFQVLQKELKCKIYYKKGNHCVRYEHFLMQKAGELIDVDEFQFENIIKSRANGIEIIGDKIIIKANELNIIHGHEFGMSVFSPVNIARGLYMRGKSNAIQGHHHRSSEHTEKDMNEKITTTWSVGCLCELHPEYLPLNNWNWGFSIIELDPNKKDFEVRNKRIYKDKVY